MSTTFALKSKSATKIAHRFGLGGKEHKVGITWLTGRKYSDNTKVVPLDNTAQGVETYGDLVKLSINGKL